MNKLTVIALNLVILLSGCSQSPGARIEVRIYQGAFSREPECREIRLEGLAGEVLSAQVVAKSGRNIEGLAGKLSELQGPKGSIIPAAAARVRYGGFIPVDETMTLVADPLLEAESVDVPANLARSVWLTLNLPQHASAGTYEGTFELAASSGGQADFQVTVEVLPARLPSPEDWSFYLNIWQDPTPVAAAHKVEPWSEEHWRLLERYAENFAAHGMKAIMTHIVYVPWHCVRGYPSQTMVVWKYPG